MLDKYVVKDGKKMKYGYTTGSCAAAASKAAAYMAINNKIIDYIKIETPKGWYLTLDVIEPVIEKKRQTAFCYIKKDAGDDPDITHGILIGARVEIIDTPKIIINGGKGVGKVTKPGLYVPVGEPAINPVPRKMIQSEILKVLPKDKGAMVTITVPEGEAIAKKTFNPKLGILGGISILGTSGIVEPMSDEAFKESLAMELRMAVQNGLDKAVLVPGNYGEENAVKLFNIDKSNILKTSNFIGFMLDKCIEEKIQKVLLIGHIGKLVKLAGGIFNTHSRVADGRLEIIAANLALEGASKELIEKVFECVTTEAAVEIIHEYNYGKIYSVLCQKAEERCIAYTHGEVEIGVIMFSMAKGLLSIGDKAKDILEEFK
ncbi:cobalt-precorrin-5B (C(1))-methyltransferase CbiD [Paramaledivibacter caminithermalis]|uniref:Cobalt-precorrin-5B C(1)-methyltransferase n=1 Tax=Paramaledivibacter caminithermalis (strain DSM 15212 / CIP 107654 / DViRD3) TaxID=1121301 RepID=A0A1M6MLY5_PARC5|nr:cobalt-precorrin-5B (C(1))-methyltransferase CbiD [Paramaledivibacter caminithermalis]SHJ84293.1 cobalt-precorrin 5B C1-methyltransferase [Paramaledivibacter caminithermalis DSM 15212]